MNSLNKLSEILFGFCHDFSKSGDQRTDLTLREVKEVDNSPQTVTKEGDNDLNNFLKNRIVNKISRNDSNSDCYKPPGMTIERWTELNKLRDFLKTRSPIDRDAKDDVKEFDLFLGIDRTKK